MSSDQEDDLGRPVSVLSAWWRQKDCVWKFDPKM